MKGTIYIYIERRVTITYGIRVILEQMKDLFDEVQVIDDVDSLPRDAVVIPYGLLASVSLWRKKKFKLYLSLMVDAYSLGLKSELCFFYMKRYVSKQFLLKHVFRYIKYLIYEYIILRNYNKVMLVSHNDYKYYLNNKLTGCYTDKIVVVPNGINISPDRHCYLQPNSPKFRIGCLSNWDILTYYTLKDFLYEIWVKIDTSHLELIIAGRGLTPTMYTELCKFNDIKILGEVKELEDFYEQVDASLITMVKECGIINRILDGFAYRVPVIARPQSFLAFKELPDCYYAYYDVLSFENIIQELRCSYNHSLYKTNVAFDYVRKHHNWENNYQIIKELVVNNFR